MRALEMAWDDRHGLFFPAVASILFLLSLERSSCAFVCLKLSCPVFWDALSKHASHLVIATVGIVAHI